MAKRKTTLLPSESLTGSAYTAAHADAADDFFRQLMAEAATDLDGVALIAVGGYGRGELWPYSDLDVLLLHSPSRSIDELADKLWYPVWDLGLKLGHSVGTVKQTLALAADELERATAYLDVRLIAGDAELVAGFEAGRDKLWRKRGNDLMTRLAAAVEQRHSSQGDVAFRLEPDLKEGRGGLRDLQALAWAERAEPGFASDLLDQLRPDAEILSRVRVELHRVLGRAGDVLSLEDHDAVAERMGMGDGADLMLEVAQAGRRIGWHSDEAWYRWEHARSRPRRGRPQADVEPGIQLVDGQLEFTDDAEVETDPLALLRMAAAAAKTNTLIGRESLQRLADSEARIPEPWPAEARQLLAAIFLAGRSAIDVVEDLEQFELMVRLLPEWARVSCKPQRNVMHLFTVDRHLCEAAANSAALADTVVRPDLLVVGTLLHDIGKGFPGDHTEVGMGLIQTIGERMGYPPEEVAVLVDLCRLHLLLPDVAVRRDLSDPGTIRAVAAAVDTVAFLDMLAALTEADSIATGPSMWGSWKAGLLRDLVARTKHVLGGGHVEEVASEFPTAEMLEWMAAGERVIVGRGSTMSVVAPDSHGHFSRLAGVMAISGLDVLDASAYSSDGMAATEFVVQSSTGAAVEWDRVIELAHAALDRRLALSARIAQRARSYARFHRRLAASPPRRYVHIDNTLSDAATVVDVHTPDTIGVLYKITQVVAELNLGIMSAKVHTLGPDAVDSFYLCDVHGNKVTDPSVLGELELALTEITRDSDTA
ncbi:MAG: [protein-PII] uridylyltransferase [Acidimicrobiales bacterium]